MGQSVFSKLQEKGEDLKCSGFSVCNEYFFLFSSCGLFEANLYSLKTFLFETPNYM